MKSHGARLVCALLILGLIFVASPAAADIAGLLDLEVVGEGTAKDQGGTCFDQALFPGCTLLVSGQMMIRIGTHLGHGTYTLQLRTGAGPLFNADSGGCLPANRSEFFEFPVQTAKLTAANGDIISFNTVGLLCEELAPGSSYQYNGTYRITGGTGEFAALVGGGKLAVTVHRITGQAFLHLHGVSRH